ncbi:hypothetical protein DK389_01955 [Methylobacterium durans]|uniref:Uncharacterized protein n=1 Tax=Methylobacterium durans TaxID=2202825 RepID=A0A2U8W0B8_9HYPH|nr:hypothetical protein DK389_01955 [Methylobacterium durans]
MNSIMLVLAVLAVDRCSLSARSFEAILVTPVLHLRLVRLAAFSALMTPEMTGDDQARRRGVP